MHRLSVRKTNEKPHRSNGHHPGLFTIYPLSRFLSSLTQATAEALRSLFLNDLLARPPILWRDWSRRQHRRACLGLLCCQRLDVQFEPAAQTPLPRQSAILTRAQRAHSRLSWQERLARNARAPTQAPPTITLFGVPDHFAAFLGLNAA